MLTYLCDGRSCEAETDLLHEAGDGIYCEEHAAARVRHALDPEAERAEQARTREKWKARQSELEAAHGQG